ncbi:hypothetical protein [Rhodopila sp.]
MLIPAAREADWYARGIGGAAEHTREGVAREVNQIPAGVDRLSVNIEGR